MDQELARQRLLAARASVLAMGRDLDASFGEIVDAARDSNLDDEHDPEGATIAVERSIVSSLSRSAAARLDAIEAALGRLTNGEYGVCQRCGSPIPDGRLEARPEAAYCIACA